MLWTLLPSRRIWDWDLKKERDVTWEDVTGFQTRGTKHGPNLNLYLHEGGLNKPTIFMVSAYFIETTKNWYEPCLADKPSLTVWENVRKGGHPLPLLEYLIRLKPSHKTRIRRAIPSSFDEWLRLQPYPGNLNAYSYSGQRITR